MPIIDLKNDPYRSVNPNRAGCVQCLEEKIDIKKEPNDQCECKGYKSVLHKSIYFENLNFRNALIDISLMCKETDITSLVFTLDDMEMLFESVDQHLTTFFKYCFTNTSYCDKISNIEWNLSK